MRTYAALGHAPWPRHRRARNSANGGESRCHNRNATSGDCPGSWPLQQSSAIGRSSRNTKQIATRHGRGYGATRLHGGAKIRVGENSPEIFCDVSQRIPRSIVPKPERKAIIQRYHGIAHSISSSDSLRQWNSFNQRLSSTTRSLFP